MLPLHLASSILKTLCVVTCLLAENLFRMYCPVLWIYPFSFSNILDNFNNILWQYSFSISIMVNDFTNPSQLSQNRKGWRLTTLKVFFDLVGLLTWGGDESYGLLVLGWQACFHEEPFGNKVSSTTLVTTLIDLSDSLWCNYWCGSACRGQVKVFYINACWTTN